MKTLNYKKMIEDINKLVQNDFAFDMECKSIPDSGDYTQEEALKMSDIIGKVYLISHCNTCSSCQTKYLI